MSLLEKLKMPIHDKKAFQEQLKAIIAEGEMGLDGQRLVERFDAKDFPILSLESAFEKFHDKFQPFPFPFPLQPPRIELPDISPERPGICEVYNDTFRDNPFAANCACESYAQAIRNGLSELQAVIIGHFAGRSADVSGVCE